MRAGNLDREIELRRSVATIDDTGAAVSVWTTLATLRAQVVQASTDEAMRNFGASTETAIVFRTRYFEGVRVTDCILYEGQEFGIKEVKELGRRRGLELRALRLGP